MRARNLIIAGLGFALLIVIWGFIPRRQYVPIRDGGYARVLRPPFWKTIPEAGGKSSITYEPKGAQEGKIVLYEDIFDGPIMLMPAADTNVLLCLYDSDIDLRLFRIDTSKQFTSVPVKSALKYVLYSSSWKIDDGTPADWSELLGYLKKVSRKDFNRQAIPATLRFGNTPESYIKSLEYQGVRASQ